LSHFSRGKKKRTFRKIVLGLDHHLVSLVQRNIRKCQLFFNAPVVPGHSTATSSRSELLSQRKQSTIMSSSPVHYITIETTVSRHALKRTKEKYEFKISNKNAFGRKCSSHALVSIAQ